MGKVGRKGLYEEWLKPEKLKQVTKWIIEGNGHNYAWKKMGISYSAFYDWIKRFDEFAKAVKEGDRENARKLMEVVEKTAIGYDYEETETKIQDGKEVYKIVRKKHRPAEPKTLHMRLANLAPEQFSDVSKVDINIKENVPAQALYEAAKERIDDIINGKTDE